MIDYSSKHLDPALLPQLLLKAANQIKGIVWVSIQKSSAVIPNQVCEFPFLHLENRN